MFINLNNLKPKQNCIILIFPNSVSIHLCVFMPFFKAEQQPKNCRNINPSLLPSLAFD